MTIIDSESRCKSILKFLEQTEDGFNVSMFLELTGENKYVTKHRGDWLDYKNSLDAFFAANGWIEISYSYMLPKDKSICKGTMYVSKKQLDPTEINSFDKISMLTRVLNTKMRNEVTTKEAVLIKKWIEAGLSDKEIARKLGTKTDIINTMRAAITAGMESFFCLETKVQYWTDRLLNCKSKAM